MDTNKTNAISFQPTELLIKHMRFIAIMQQIFGVIFIIVGALTCLGIITAIIGIPQIIAGVKLFKSGNAFSLAASVQKENDIIDAIENLYGYWKYALITFIASILFFIIYMIIIVSIIASFSSSYY
ncbi:MULTISPECIES: DUF5362 family protein [unclassified Gilliamella]|uniref:DUF5362 family protein n=1 Tax=unclassified Gilliamella TaxID=2685620 RepID=UPI00132365AE|nr:MULTISPECIES: DUF5362 family protein [unclassified Gilliamella]MWN32132.1 hypothetical protein [Gilliamella sp. Pra-s60]MWP29391.1 hypothetical protein [Gilliamella sp. Pra-s54]